MLSSVASLLLYILCFSLAGLLMYVGLRKSNKLIIAASLLLPVLLAAFRYDVGTDYSTYLAMFNRMSSQSLVDFFNSGSTAVVEVGFYSLMKLSDIFSHDASFFFTVSSFLTIWFFYLGLRKLEIAHSALVYFLYLMIIFPMTLNIVRQGIALSICFYAFTFMIQRNPKKFIVWTSIAALFHGSALFLLPTYLLVGAIKEDRKNAYLSLLAKLGAIALAVLLLLPHLFGLISLVPGFEKYSIYQTYTGEGANMTFFLQLCILIAVIVFAKWSISKDRVRVYFFFLLFAILELIFMTLGFSSSFMKRISLYFSIFSLMLMANLVDIFSDKLGRFLVTGLIVIYALFYFILAYYMLGQAEIIPFKFATGASL